MTDITDTTAFLFPIQIRQFGSQPLPGVNASGLEFANPCQEVKAIGF